MAGNFFHPPHPHSHTDHPIDFINRDSHLLGKLEARNNRSNAELEKNIAADDTLVVSEYHATVHVRAALDSKPQGRPYCPRCVDLGRIQDFWAEYENRKY